MIEVRFHGRGGQGVVVASEVLANAAFREGFEVASFPYFGVERRGAPVTAYARYDRKPIRLRSSIYEPDYVVVLDSSLMYCRAQTKQAKLETKGERKPVKAEKKSSICDEGDFR